jgi:hypothetical protein
MLETDLMGLWNSLKNNQMFHLIILLLVCFCLYNLLSSYTEKKSLENKINQLNHLLIITNGNSGNGGCGNYGNYDNIGNSGSSNIANLDESVFRNTIDLPNRNPDMLTTSMVLPKKRDSDEERRRARMDVLNMFYNSFDDDLISINSRPQDLYIIP